ncbi:FCD domain-containing protein [Brucella pseudogrignonensis]|uniref:GntR C-terminal domain-containing protein n=1 Tax=Brucella pseudogrignonensis TaxID=419475 RepID=A0ABU1MBL1_9HYPH|nr:FCD domain-containing protein [Brucella pseudogrignonensis]MDR6433414.1 hypothetical protein [Brucella pseudogrignonensis]
MKMLPQPAFSRNLNPALITPEFIQNTVVEHRSICETISARHAEQARAAMQAHLTRNHQRYRGLSGSIGSPLAILQNLSRLSECEANSSKKVKNYGLLLTAKKS